jgi:hypothetical protein
MRTECIVTSNKAANQTGTTTCPTHGWPHIHVCGDTPVEDLSMSPRRGALTNLPPKQAICTLKQEEQAYGQGGGSRIRRVTEAVKGGHAHHATPRPKLRGHSSGAPEHGQHEAGGGAQAAGCIEGSIGELILEDAEADALLCQARQNEGCHPHPEQVLLQAIAAGVKEGLLDPRYQESEDSSG